jgi:hypothetical protein
MGGSHQSWTQAGPNSPAQARSVDALNRPCVEALTWLGIGSMTSARQSNVEILGDLERPCRSMGSRLFKLKTVFGLGFSLDAGSMRSKLSPLITQTDPGDVTSEVLAAS